MTSIKFSFFLLVVFCSTIFSCSDKSEPKVKDANLPTYDLIEIKVASELRALVDNSSTSYFIYKGRPMGFEYELLSRFAKALKVKLTIIPINNLDGIIDSLKDFKGDIIAANLTVTKERANDVSFSLPLIRSKQVLIQRKADDKEMKFVERPSDLVGKEIYIRKNSSFYQRLQNLSEEIGGEIIIKEVAGKVTVEELIKKVAESEIDYTIADEHVARINKAFYPNLNVKTAISLEQRMAWAVRKESPDLLIALNEWLKNFKKTIDYRVIYLKYFGNSSLYRTRVNSEYFTSKSGTLSPYDEIIKDLSEDIGWDWRLVTALVYQESKFDANAKSWAGATGLMQLMPETAASYGIDSISSAHANLAAGIKYLNWIEEQFVEKVQNPTERQKFVLAAYNVGLGHVFDAIRLAEKKGKNPEVWFENVALMLLNKANPEYYKDEVVNYGYCRGSEPYKYVREVMSRYEHYKNIEEIVSSN